MTPGVASSSQPPPQQMQALRENMEEQDLIDALDDALEKAEPEVQATSSTTPVDERRRKKAKNQIEPVKEDPYQDRPISIQDDAEDEETNAEFLAQLIAADEAKERKDRRQQLLKDTKEEGAIKTESEDHLMRDFLESKPSDRQALWAKVKQEQADLIADARKEWRTSKSSNTYGSKDSAEGDLRRTGDTSIATIRDRARPIFAGAAR